MKKINVNAIINWIGQIPNDGSFIGIKYAYK